MPLDRAETPEFVQEQQPRIKIEDGVPMPSGRHRGRYGGTGLVAALRSLEIGQSFVAPNPRGLAPKRLASDALSGARGVPAKKFATRIVTEKGERVVRVWRRA